MLFSSFIITIHPGTIPLHRCYLRHLIAAHPRLARESPYSLVMPMEFAMLRMTCQPTGKGQLFRLEGKLLSAWVPELESCLALHTEQTPVQLDLSALSFADSSGVKVARDAEQHGIALSGCTGFFQSLLRSERS